MSGQQPRSMFEGVYDRAQVEAGLGSRGLLPLAAAFARTLAQHAEEKGLQAWAGKATEAADMLASSQSLALQASYQLANVAAALSGDSLAAWQAYGEMRSMQLHNRPEFHNSRWGGGKVDGTLLIHTNPGQGFGDSLQHAGQLPQALRMADHVVWEVQPKLKNLLRNVVLPPDLSSRFTLIAAGEPLPAFTVATPLMDLPQSVGINLQRFIPEMGAYLKAPQVSDVAHQQWIDENITEPRARGELVIGLAWQGDKNNKPLEPERSPDLKFLTDILELPHVRVINLQFGKDAMEQRKALPAHLQAKFVDMPATFDQGAHNGFCDTAAAMSKLDAMVSSDTATLHLAGAMGVKTLGLLPNTAELRWPGPLDPRWQEQDGALTLCHNYYANMQVFRQPEPGNWQAVGRAAACHLAAYKPAQPINCPG